MSCILREFPLQYAVLSEGRRGVSARAVHEPSPADPSYRASSIMPARTSARAAPPRCSSGPSAPRVGLHLRPGHKGTNELVAQYGDRLICVRYRYDAQRKKRFKTVDPPRFAHDHIVGLRVAFADVAVRDQVKRAGGTWNPDRRVWQVRYDRVIALGLTRLIVDDPASSSGCSEP